MKKTLAVLAAAGLAVTALVGAAAAPAKPQAQKNLVQIAASDKQFTTLVSLVTKAGLAGAPSKGSLTVFAPTNWAFAYLKKTSPATYNAVATNKALLKKVLTYHVIGSKVPASAALAAAKKKAKVKTLEGEKISLSVKNGAIYLNGNAKVVKADIKGSNGIIHVINRVLVPPSAS